ncbi:hypothetical protein VNO78_35114 [Psophocarpus tetragonolobus]|uniref:Uncharacterized protein n=1 Tax=Psophocarpus tetragonolobus TaxID=3891 RepID=A0AAN9NU06_PSOTE
MAGTKSSSFSYFWRTSSYQGDEKLSTITEAMDLVASSTPFNRLATELTQGSRKERASRQLRQHKLELRNTEEKRIQLNLSLRAVQRRESKVNGQWRISPSPGFILNRPR